MSRRTIVLLGPPHSGIEAQARRLAVDGGTYLRELSITAARTVADLLAMHELAQVPQHEPLHAVLRLHLREARHDPAAFLAAHAHWSIGELVDALFASLRDGTVTLSDGAAGFRILDVERWFELLPEALFVHVVTPLDRFVDAATQAYRGELFVPPDFRDFHYRNVPPVIRPELAWYQVNCTLARAFSDATSRRRCRVDIGQLNGLSPARLAELGRKQSASGGLDWPYARAAERAMAPSIEQLIASLATAPV